MHFSFFPKRSAKQFLKYSAWGLVIWIGLHTVLVAIDGLTDHLPPSDVAIVFGNTVHPDGTPSKRLLARLLVAVALYQKGSIRHIIVSGGIGKEGIDEASVMKQILIQKGIPTKSIIADSRGNNTWLTAANFVALNKTHHFKSVILVSQFFHLSRAKLIFTKMGVSQLGTAHADYYEWRDGYSLLREFPAFYVYLFR